MARVVPLKHLESSSDSFHLSDDDDGVEPGQLVVHKEPPLALSLSRSLALSLSRSVSLARSLSLSLLGCANRAKHLSLISQVASRLIRPTGVPRS